MRLLFPQAWPPNSSEQLFSGVMVSSWLTRWQENALGGVGREEEEGEAGGRTKMDKEGQNALPSRRSMKRT